MKLKKFLMISHLLVLFTPIICLLAIYQITMNYYKATEFKDYTASTVELYKYTNVLENPDLYSGVAIKEDLDDLVRGKDVVISLYSAKGLTLYCSVPNREYMVEKEYLYRDLMEISHGYNADSLKMPVFEGETIVGFYEVVVPRENIKAVVNRNLFVGITAFLMIISIIFLLVIKRVNTRFNKPIRDVIKSMNDYAKGNNEVYISYKAHDEIGELCDHFNEMKEEIEASKKAVAKEQRSKEYMIATISHDLKTPLTAIRAYAEMFKLGTVVEGERFNEYLETMISKCDYMKDMLDDLLTYTLLTMDYKLNTVEVEGDEFCDMLFSGIEALCREKQLILEQNIEVNGDYLVDVKYMTRVIDNIVSNAIRHTETGGKVWMGAFSFDVSFPEWAKALCFKSMERYKAPGMVVIIKNQGMPINEEEAKRLFLPFYQGDEARSKKEHKGVGLGLSISKMIMDKHHGSIEIVPLPEEGNAFICYLPDSSYKGAK